MGSIALRSTVGSKGKKIVIKKSVRATKTAVKVIDIATERAKRGSKHNDGYLSSKQREELVINYRLKARKLARSILRKWHARLDLQEVDSVVDLSLCEAVKRFNPKMGASFMTFLFYHLRGNLIRAVSAAACANVVPVNDIEGLIQSSQEGMDSAQRALPNRGVNAIEIAEALCGNEYPMPDEIVFKRELINLSHEACDKLDDLAKEVISRIYLQGQQLIDIANSLGYSRCHISRVKKKALETLYQDLSGAMGLPEGATRPNFDEEDDSLVKNVERRKIFRRRPRSKTSIRHAKKVKHSQLVAVGH
jgi:RNA polymerase sigma factor FliA